MLDDLRNSASSSYQEEPELPPEEEAPRVGVRRAAGGGGTFLGMTSGQRFVVALMLLILTCVCGTMALLLTESVVLPF